MTLAQHAYINAARRLDLNVDDDQALKQWVATITTMTEREYALAYDLYHRLSDT